MVGLSFALTRSMTTINSISTKLLPKAGRGLEAENKNTANLSEQKDLLSVNLPNAWTGVQAHVKYGSSGAQSIVGWLLGSYKCDAKCHEVCDGETTRYIYGSSKENCREATKAAKAKAVKGCYPRHCSCEDTDGFSGTGASCEQHTR